MADGDLTRHHEKPVAVSYVWDSRYDGLTFPRKQTTVLEIQASPSPHYWRATVLSPVVDGHWVEDSRTGVTSRGEGLDKGSCRRSRGRSIAVVKQRVTVEGLADERLTGASVPYLQHRPGPRRRRVWPVGHRARGADAAARGHLRGHELRAEADPEELARSKPVYPPLISDRRGYLEVDQGVSLPPFGTPGRWGVVNASRVYVRGRRIDPYRPLELRARKIAGSAKSPYAAAVALERWFRTGGGFVYNQHPPRVKAGVPALVDFVSRTHEGYCQHFAGAMALMLRYLGIPARVAAGFNSGSYDKTRASGRLPTTTRTPGSRSGSAAGAGFRSTRLRAAAAPPGPTRARRRSSTRPSRLPCWRERTAWARSPSTGRSSASRRRDRRGP